MFPSNRLRMSVTSYLGFLLFATQNTAVYIWIQPEFWRHVNCTRDHVPLKCHTAHRHAASIISYLDQNTDEAFGLALPATGFNFHNELTDVYRRTASSQMDSPVSQLEARATYGSIIC